MDHLTLKTNLADILTQYPQSAALFRKFGLPVSG